MGNFSYKTRKYPKSPIHLAKKNQILRAAPILNTYNTFCQDKVLRGEDGSNFADVNVAGRLKQSVLSGKSAKKSKNQ